MQGMAEDFGGAAVPQGNQELFGCLGIGAHQNGSIGPEGTSLSAGARVGEGAESTQQSASLCSAGTLYPSESPVDHTGRRQAENYFSPNPRAPRVVHEQAPSMPGHSNLYNAYGQLVYPAAYSPYANHPTPPEAVRHHGAMGQAIRSEGRPAVQPGLSFAVQPTSKPNLRFNSKDGR